MSRPDIEKKIKAIVPETAESIFAALVMQNGLIHSSAMVLDHLAHNWRSMFWGDAKAAAKYKGDLTGFLSERSGFCKNALAAGRLFGQSARQKKDFDAQEVMLAKNSEKLVGYVSGANDSISYLNVAVKLHGGSDSSDPVAQGVRLHNLLTLTIGEAYKTTDLAAIELHRLRDYFEDAMVGRKDALEFGELELCLDEFQKSFTTESGDLLKAQLALRNMPRGLNP